MEPDNPPEIGLALRVTEISNSELANLIPELENYLKARYPKVRAVGVTHQNPQIQDSRNSYLCFSHLPHDTWLLITLLNPITNKLLSNLADDTYKWFKKLFKVVKAHRKRARPIRKTQSRTR